MANLCLKVCSDYRKGWMALLAISALLFSGPAAMAQQPVISGTISDQSGQPVVGASIIEQGTTNGTTTGIDGSYAIKLKGGG